MTSTRTFTFTYDGRTITVQAKGLWAACALAATLLSKEH